MMRFAVLSLVLIMAACTQPQTPAEPPAPAATSNNGALPAPTPSDVTIRINAAQDGQTVQVGVNQRFAVELVGIPTAGYVWQPAQMPAFLTRAGDASGPTISAQNQPGYAGGNHWEVLMFAATGPGSGQLVIEQRRPWETNEPPVHVFRVTIVAH
ncbi:MAG: protease inhibitor I42 family protein [Proteobacteria bacterium]|nr:protease inhibitor I42 family protein [Pseudomonadota bacterium]